MSFWPYHHGGCCCNVCLTSRTSPPPTLQAAPAAQQSGCANSDLAALQASVATLQQQSNLLRAVIEENQGRIDALEQAATPSNPATLNVVVTTPPGTAAEAALIGAYTLNVAGDTYTRADTLIEIRFSTGPDRWEFWQTGLGGVVQASLTSSNPAGAYVGVAGAVTAS